MHFAQDGRRGRAISAWGYAIGLCVLLADAPAKAQTQDPFQSAPVTTTPAAPAAPVTPAAPAPKPQPRPQPHRPVEPDPYAAMPAPVAPAPPPAASLPPPGVMWARIRQVAQSSGIGVPLASDPPFDIAGAGPQFGILVGAWGPGIWQGPPGDRLMLIVLAVDGGASVRGVVARDVGTDWANFSAPMSGGGFAVHIQTSYEASGRFNTTRTLEDEFWQFQLRPDGRLYGSRANGSTVVLDKLR